MQLDRWTCSTSYTSLAEKLGLYQGALNENWNSVLFLVLSLPPPAVKPKAHVTESPEEERDVKEDENGLAPFGRMQSWSGGFSFTQGQT